MTGNDLQGKVAIITGAAGGFGRALVKAFVEHGIRVGAADIDASALKTMEAEYGRDRAMALPFDVSDPGACAVNVQRTADHFGGLHILVNNAAAGLALVAKDHFNRTVQIEEIDVPTWQKFIAVNLSGAFYLAKAAVPIFRKQHWGRMINVTTSLFTMLNPGFSPYGPAKAGLEAWSASLAGELKGSGITVNVVVPGGPADTPMVPKESGFDRSSLIAPELMAPPMLFLCSEEGGSITGRRFLAREWDSTVAPSIAAQASNPIGWPSIAHNIKWPTGKPA